jgi:hypothetical protein
MKDVAQHGTARLVAALGCISLWLSAANFISIMMTGVPARNHTLPCPATLSSGVIHDINR